MSVIKKRYFEIVTNNENARFVKEETESSAIISYEIRQNQTISGTNRLVIVPGADLYLPYYRGELGTNITYKLDYGVGDGWTDIIEEYIRPTDFQLFPDKPVNEFFKIDLNETGVTLPTTIETGVKCTFTAVNVYDGIHIDASIIDPPENPGADDIIHLRIGNQGAAARNFAIDQVIVRGGDLIGAGNNENWAVINCSGSITTSIEQTTTPGDVCAIYNKSTKQWEITGSDFSNPRRTNIRIGCSF